MAIYQLIQSFRTKVALEAFLLILQVAFSITPFVLNDLSEEFLGHSTTLVFNLVSWLYLLGVSALRVSTASTGLSDRFPDFWYHSFTLYVVNLLAASCLFVSEILGGVESYTASLFYKINFALTFSIFLVSGLQKLSDKPAMLYISDGSPNGLETVSNIFQVICFSWINPMIVKAHRTPLKSDDIMTLEAKDHSYPILAKYHAQHRTKSLTSRIFHQFKWDFAQQFTCTAITAALVFVPIICTKKILEYLENPDLISRKSAWLYTFMMFASGVLYAILEARGLFVGRRMMLHINSILIAELYSKGMKRTFMRFPEANDEKDKDNGDIDSVKGSKDEDSAQSFKKEKSDEKNKDLGSIINIMSVDAQKVSNMAVDIISINV
ncbi:unnamed protein product [Ambrosiozyma monospora]|uniref:Unnamed protein product n=1 Tax=Ambrosiozyma monospora TaxID=43982 RepID=A0ACB5TB23_AMBMO|nr:unnamed protein product [Ambrosiozyma monospora]